MFTKEQLMAMSRKSKCCKENKQQRRGVFAISAVKTFLKSRKLTDHKFTTYKLLFPDDFFYNVSVDSQDNIICVGAMNFRNPDNITALVVKFDSELYILTRKLFTTGIGDDCFNTVTVDSRDNIICTGYTKSKESGVNEPFIIKFDVDLNIIERKIYNVNGSDCFYAITTDSQDNIICVGACCYCANDAIAIKFDPSLNIIECKRYHDDSDDQ